MTQKKCTLAPKHAWSFVRNVTLRSTRISLYGTTMKISFRGLYKCACGESRFGDSRSEVTQ